MRRVGDDGLQDVLHQKMFDAETQDLKWDVIVKKVIYKRRDRRHSGGC